MAIRYLADVQSATEHEAFQRVVKLYPAYPYDEWGKRQSKNFADLVAAGHEVRMVKVTADEFVAYCDRTRAKRDINTFFGFVSEAGKRQP